MVGGGGGRATAELKGALGAPASLHAPPDPSASVCPTAHPHATLCSCSCRVTLGSASR